MSEEKEEVQEEKSETKQTRVTINLTFVVVALILAFAYIYVENGKIARQEAEKAQQKIEHAKQTYEYNKCISDAYDNYIYQWNKTCKRFKKKDDCALPSYNANSIENAYSQTKQQCMDKLKNNAFPSL